MGLESSSPRNNF